MNHLPQLLLVLWVTFICWKASQPPDDDHSGGKLQPVYIKK
jgi:hypothetical protein